MSQINKEVGNTNSPAPAVDPVATIKALENKVLQLSEGNAALNKENAELKAALEAKETELLEAKDQIDQLTKPSVRVEHVEGTPPLEGPSGTGSDKQEDLLS